MPVLGGYAITVNWGSAAGVFTKITGIKADTAVLDQNVSSEKGSPKILKIPGKYGCYPVTLSAGYMEQLQAEGPWWAGLKKIQEGEIGSTRADCTITFWSTAKVPVLIVVLAGRLAIQVERQRPVDPEEHPLGRDRASSNASP